MTQAHDGPEDDKPMPLLDHLIELRKRLIYALLGFFLVFFVTFYFAKPIFSFLIQPAMNDGYKVVVLDIFEFFFVTVKLSAFVSLIVGFPLIAIQIWLFVAPGLYRQEKRAFLPFLIATPFMFYAGCVVMYYVVMPYVINFMLTQYVPPDIEKTLRSSDYLERVLQLVFAFGFAFEMPVLLTLLVRVGIVTHRQPAGQAALRHRGLFHRRSRPGAAGCGEPDRARRAAARLLRDQHPDRPLDREEARGGRQEGRGSREQGGGNPRQLAMHDIRFIRDHPEAFDAGLKKRNLPPLAAELLEIDKRRRAAISESEAAQARRKALSRQIGIAKAKGEPIEALMGEVANLEQSLKKGEAEAQRLDEELTRRLEVLPNLPFDDVPDGTDETANVEIRRVGNQRNFAFAPKDHAALGEATGEMDFAAASKISGSRFVFLKGRLAKLERAIAQFMLDLHTSEEGGYTEVIAPFLVRDDAAYGVGQLPQVRRRHVPYRQRLLADPDGRGAAHQPGDDTDAGREATCRCASPPGRRAFAPRRVPPARTRAA